MNDRKPTDKPDKSPGWIWLYCLTLSAGFLLICTKSSPLHPFNDWVDANAFFTMGKGMMNGQVPYRDLFEQKGPLLYFLYGIAYLVSRRSFFGVYLLEALSFAWFLYSAQRLMRIYAPLTHALAFLPILPFIVLNSPAFAHGGSAEEFCLPLIAFSLFHLVNAVKPPVATPLAAGRALAAHDRSLLLNGLAAGCVLWIKFSLLGFWIGWLPAVLLSRADGGSTRRIARHVLLFGSGVLLATLPWIAYFCAHQALGDLIDTYFLANIRYYAVHATLLQRLLTPLWLVAVHAFENPLVSLPLFGGLIGFAASGACARHPAARMSIPVCASLLMFGVYGGGRHYVYYFLIVAPFAVLGLVCLERLLRTWSRRILSGRLAGAAALAASAALILAASRLGPNVDFMKNRQEDLVQYQFAAVINESPAPTLLNYGFLDMGFYTVTGLTPDIRFFQKQNIDEQVFPQNMAEQRRCIEGRTTEFVVLRKNPEDDRHEAELQYVCRHYDVVMARPQVYEHTGYMYYLLKRKATGS